VPLGIVMVPVALIVKQPDFGSAVLIVAVALSILYIAGTRFRYLAGSVLTLVPVAVTLVMMKGYRMDRWNTFLDPWKDPQHKGFQIIQSFLSFGSGGPFGVGLGDGMQKLFYLPEPHTDFIFSVIGEELGVAGVLLIILLYLLIVWKGIRIARHAPDLFGCFLAVGLTAALALQICINMGVTLGLLPTKGLTLPFLSYGGTSLVLNMATVGILMNIAAAGKTARGLA
jgi:cell division protein FtsW